MSLINQPAEDLIVTACQFNKDAVAIVRQARFDLPIPAEMHDVDDWRSFVPRSVRRLWGRLGLEAQLVAYIAANTERIGGE